jgi:Tol biopolymer transport system component
MRVTGWAWIGAGLVTLTACGDLTGPGRPIDTGTLVGDPVNLPDEYLFSSPVWTPDGRTLLYGTTPNGPGGPGSVVAYDVEAQTRRILYQAPDLYALSVLPSADGRLVFFRGRPDSASGLGGPVVYRLPFEGGLPELLPGLERVDTLSVSPDNQHLVYRTAGLYQPSSLAAYRLSDGTSRTLMPGGALAYSPDGARLLYRRGAGGYGMVDLETAADETLDAGLAQDEYATAFRWDQTGVHLLVKRYDYPGYHFVVRDVSAGETRPVYREGFDGFMEPWIGWSADGTRIGFWIWKCLENPGLFSCDRSQNSLYVVDLASGKETWIAGGPEGGAGPVFSPDGSRVVYSIGSARWYVSAVNP